MDEPPPPRFRVEHRPPGGGARALTATDLLTIAFAERDAWARRLRRAGEEGAVLVVRQRTGQAFAPVPIEPA